MSPFTIFCLRHLIFFWEMVLLILIILIAQHLIYLHLNNMLIENNDGLWLISVSIIINIVISETRIFKKELSHKLFSTRPKKNQSKQKEENYE